MKGKIKFFNINKGFGYVTGDDGNEYFVKRRNIKLGRKYIGLDEEDEVEFEVVDGPKGPIATEITMTNPPKSKKAEEKPEPAVTE